MKKLFFVAALSLPVMVGCTTFGGGSNGGVVNGHAKTKLDTVSLSETPTETHVRRTIEVICKKPVTNPDIHNFDRMIQRHAAHAADSASATRIKSQYGLTYRQEVMSYRLCMDYANGAITAEQYLRQNEKLLNSIE